MSTLGDLIVKVGADISGFVAAMSTVTERLNTLGDEAEKNLAAVEAVGHRLAIAGAEISAAVTLPIMGLGVAAIETAGKFEQTQIAFTHFLGSAQAAKNYLADLYEFAKTTPFQITDITQGATKLMAMGFAAKEVTPMLRILGDQLSAVGRMDQLGNIILAFGEMKAKGVASFKEIRQMVTDGVIPALRYMSEAMGISESEVMDRLKKKAIDSGTAIKAITEGMARDTGGMMQEQMGSFVGMMTNVKDNLTLTLKAIGDTLIPYAKVFSEFANKALEMVKTVAQAFAALPSSVQGFILSVALLAAALGPALLAIGGLAIVIPAVISALAPIAGVLGISVLAFSGWAAGIGIAVAALVGLGIWVNQNWEPIKAVITQAWAGLKEMWAGPWTWAKEFLLTTWEFLSSAAKTIWSGTGGYIKSIWGGVVDYFSVAWNLIKAGFSALMGIAEKIPGMKKLLSLGDAWAEAKSIVAFNENLKQQGEAYKGIQGEMRRAAMGHHEAAEAAEEHGNAVEQTSFKYNQWNKRSLDWAMWLREHTAELAKQNIAFAQLSTAIESGGMGDEAAALGAHMSELGEMHRKAGKDISDFFDKADAGHYVQDIADAYKKLGVESTASLKQQAAEMATAYRIISTSGHATTDQLQQAWIAMEEARIRATEAATGKILSMDRLKLSIAKDKEQQKPGANLDLLGKNSMAAFSTSFNSAIQGLMNGTMRWKTAWGSMVQSMYQAWTGTLAQMATQWAAMQIKKLVLHLLTNAGILTSDATTASAAHSISIGHHLKEIAMAAKRAAAYAFTSAMKLPFPVNVVAAPIAAAGAFVGVMAFGALSAERGADLPNSNAFVMTHPREMILPAALADVVRGMAGHGSPNQAGGNHYSGDVHYHAAAGEKMSESGMANAYKGLLRSGRLTGMPVRA